RQVYHELVQEPQIDDGTHRVEWDVAAPREEINPDGIVVEVDAYRHHERDGEVQRHASHPIPSIHTQAPAKCENERREDRPEVVAKEDRSDGTQALSRGDVVAERVQHATPSRQNGQ